MEMLDTRVKTILTKYTQKILSHASENITILINNYINNYKGGLSNKLYIKLPIKTDIPDYNNYNNNNNLYKVTQK